MWRSARAVRTRRYLVLLAVMIGCMSPVFANAAVESARALYKEGLREYRAGEIRTAIDLFRASQEADPVYPYPTFALARIYHEFFNQEMRDYAAAVDAYQRLDRILQASPPPEKERALYQAYYFQGLLYLKGGEYQKALDSLQRFLLIYSDFANLASVHNGIGIALYYLDQYDQAVEAFWRAIDANPDYPEARFNLRSVFTRLSVYNEAVAIARTGELDLAMEKVDRLKEFAPRYLPGRRLEAKLLQSQQRPQEAIRVYREILGIDGDHPITYDVRLEMARIHEQLKEPEEAIRLLRENLGRFPNIGDERLQREVKGLLERLGRTP